MMRDRRTIHDHGVESSRLDGVQLRNRFWPLQTRTQALKRDAAGGQCAFGDAERRPSFEQCIQVNILARSTGKESLIS
jgi:hypothetical protein